MSVKGVGFLCFCQGFRDLSNLKLHFLYLAEVGANFFRKVMKSQRQKGHCATRGSETMLWPTTAITITHINLHFLCCSLSFFVTKPLCSAEGFSTKNAFHGTTQKRHHDQPSNKAISIPPPSKPPHVQLVLLLLAWSPWVPAQ